MVSDDGTVSPSSRRAWIEIASAWSAAQAARVALLAEGVDRNLWFWGMKNADEVALLAEGVDRNILSLIRFYLSFVALLAEGVDRNRLVREMPYLSIGRPPRGGRG